MGHDRRQRSTQSRVLWGIFGMLLLLLLVLLYLQFGMHPSLWEILTDTADY